jgi:uncharacterized membrane protein YfcA
MPVSLHQLGAPGRRGPGRLRKGSNVSILFGLTAFLYSLAGHAGASAYLPLALACHLGPVEARSVALLLNLVVAAVGALSFGMAGQLRPRLLLPLLAGSLPFAFLGSRLIVHRSWLPVGMGLAMLWAAWRFSFGKESDDSGELAAASPAWLVAAGAVLGLASGLTGIGGGIYLSPLLLFKRLATARQAAALSACFIGANSLVSLLATGASAFPRSEWVAACLVGGLLGASLGSRLLSPKALRGSLACVLVLAALKSMVP